MMVSIEELDPHQSYRIFARNRDYSGVSFGVRFGGGEAVVHGLPQTATEEQKERRLAQLRAFLNAEPQLRQLPSGEWRAYRPYILREEERVQIENPFDDEVPPVPPEVDPDAEFAVGVEPEDLVVPPGQVRAAQGAVEVHPEPEKPRSRSKAVA